VKRIYVGNIGNGCTEAVVRSEFEAYGRVEQVTITSDYAVVEMANDSEAERALSGLNDRAWFFVVLTLVGINTCAWEDCCLKVQSRRTISGDGECAMPSRQMG
jgi:RNA recognition motif-containing protein